MTGLKKREDKAMVNSFSNWLLAYLSDRELGYSGEFSLQIYIYYQVVNHRFNNDFIICFVLALDEGESIYPLICGVSSKSLVSDFCFNCR